MNTKYKIYTIKLKQKSKMTHFGRQGLPLDVEYELCHACLSTSLSKCNRTDELICMKFYIGEIY